MKTIQLNRACPVCGGDKWGFLSYAPENNEMKSFLIHGEPGKITATIALTCLSCLDHDPLTTPFTFEIVTPLLKEKPKSIDALSCAVLALAKEWLDKIPGNGFPEDDPMDHGWIGKENNVMLKTFRDGTVFTLTKDSGMS